MDCKKFEGFMMFNAILYTYLVTSRFYSQEGPNKKPKKKLIFSNSEDTSSCLLITLTKLSKKEDFIFWI